MQNNYVNIILNKAKMRRLWKRVLALLCAIVIFFTANILRHNASTLVRTPSCGFPDHQHSPDCYNTAGELICDRHVHTEACYQSGLEPAVEEAETVELSEHDDAAAGPEAVNTASVEAETEEAGAVPAGIEASVAEAGEIVLGEAVEALDGIAPEPGENIPEISGMRAETPEYPVGSQSVILLSEMLRMLDLEVADIVSVGQVIGEDNAPALVEVEKVGEDYEIRPLGAFDEAEIAIETGTDIVLVKLVESWVEGEEDVTAPHENHAGETTEEDTTIDAPEAIKEGDGQEVTLADKTEEKTDFNVNVDGADENTEGDAGGEDNPGDEGAAAEAVEKPVAETVVGTDQQAGAETATEADERVEAETVTAVDDMAEAETDTAADDKAETDTAADDKAETGTEVDDKAETDTAADDKAETVTEVDDKAEADTAADDKAETDTEVDDKAETETDTAADDRAETVTAADDMAGAGNKGSGEGESPEPSAVSDADGEADGAAAEGADTVLSYIFGEEKTVLLTDILARLELTVELSKCDVELSGDAPVRLDIQEEPFECSVTAEDLFDSAILILKTTEGEFEIVLSNPGPGKEMTSVDGAVTLTFEEDVELPKGVTLTAEPMKPELDGEALDSLNAMLAEALNGRVGDVQWFDISLGDVHDIHARVTLKCTVTPGQRMAVAHLRDDGAIDIISEVEVEEDGITFETFGFSPFAIATAAPRRLRLLGATGANGEGETWDFDPETGVLTIHDQAAIQYTSYTAAGWYKNGYKDQIKSIVVEEGKGITTIPAQFLGSSSGSTNYYPLLETVTLPEGITSIGNYAFQGCRTLKSVNIPEGVTSIGSNAFYYCSALKSIELPESLTSLGTYAFYYCSALESVNIPAGLKRIGDYTFYYSSALKAIDIPEGVTSIGPYAFRYCSSLTSLDFPEGLTNFGTYAFANCTSVTSINIPDSASEITIGTHAFRNTGVTSIKLPEGLKTINSYILRNCTNLKSVTIPSTVTNFTTTNAFTSSNNIQEFIFDENNPLTTIPNMFQSRTALKRIVLPRNLGTVAANQFYGCTSLETVEMSDMVQTIGNYAFYNCSRLTDLEMPQYLKTIGSYAFYNTGLSEVELPPSVNSMGAYAFQNCKYLESVDMESCTGLKTLPTSAFNGCGNLETVSFPEGLEKIGESCFSNCAKLIVDNASPGVLNIPPTVTEIGATAFQGCSQLKKVVIPDSVTSLGDKAFLNCTGLEEMEIGAGITTFPTGLFMGAGKLRRVSFASNDSITAIPNDAFNGCARLEEFVMPASVQTIGSNAFKGCAGLTAVDFPATVTSIGASAYSGCTKLTQAAFNAGENPLAIGANAFQNCAGLTEVAFPENLQSIGASAYTGCASLTDVTFASGDCELTIGSNAFKDLKKLTDVDFPANLKSIGESAFENDTAIRAIAIPEGEGEVSIGKRAFAGTGLTALDARALPDRVTEIGENAFLNCKQLTAAALPAGITDLSPGVFNGCAALTSVELDDALVNIGSNAFNGCTSLPSIALTENVETIGKSAFSGCTKLTSIGFNDRLNAIGESAFNNCDSLPELTVPGNVKTLGNTAFYGCDRLTDVTLQEGVTTLGNNVFQNCARLNTVDIADSVTEMGTGVFQDCASLSSARLPAGIATLPENTFKNCARLTTPDFSACANLTAIGASAFEGCQNLPQADLTPCASLTTIGASAFSGCKHMTGVSLPDSVTTIGASAFSGCTALPKLTIPQNTATIGENALTGCQSLNELVWDAADGSIGAFSSGTHFTLTLGGHVDNLSQDALTALVNGGANALKFEGENDFTLPALDGYTDGAGAYHSYGLPRPLSGLGAGQYHADANGALYKIEDGKATLVYVPDGLDSYTIPAALATGVPVTGVGNNALYAAQSLRTLTVAAPENIEVLESAAFANARNLERVNGETDRGMAEALFTGAEKGALLFDNTKLTETIVPVLQESLQYGVIRVEGQPDTIDPRDTAKGWPTDINVTITQASQTRRTNQYDEDGNPLYQKDASDMPRDENGVYLAFTGDPLVTTIDISNPASAQVPEGDKIRIYFKTDAGCNFPDYELDKITQISGTKTLEDGTVVPSYTDLLVRETDVPGVRYYQFDRPENGATFNIQLASNYPSPNTPGGDVMVWAEYIKSDDVDNTAGKATDPVQKRQVVNRATVPDPFVVDKSASSTSALTPVGAADGRAYIPQHSYTIDLKRGSDNAANPFLNNVGKDYVISADIEDTFELPPEIMLNPAIIEEIRNNRITTSTSTTISNNKKTTTHTLVSPTCGTILTFRENAAKENYLAPALRLSGDEKNIVLTWHLVNNSYESYQSGQATTYLELDEHYVTMTVSNRVLCLSDSAERNTAYTFKNTVSAALHYAYSADQTSRDEATYRVNSGDAKLSLSKTYDQSSTNYRGEYRPYTITLTSDGMLPLTLNELDEIVDVIDTNSQTYRDSHYIDADGIWQMFADTSRQFGETYLSDLLTLTIDYAHLYGGEGSEALAATKKNIINDRGVESAIATSQANTSFETSYSGRSASDPYDLGQVAKFTFSKNAQGEVQCAVTVDGQEPVTETVSGAEAIQALFDRYGFFLTRWTRYTVDWDLKPLGDDFRMPVGDKLVIKIPTRVKDVFMRLEEDRLEKEPTASRNNYTDGYDYTYNRAAVKKDGTQKAYSDVSPKLYRDAFLYKSVSGVEAARQIYVFEDADEANRNQTYYDAVQYTVNPRHQGAASYELMPLTDHMYGRQALLVPANGANAAQSWAEGLETYSLDGVDYYLLTRGGTYKKVWTGDRWADHVEVVPQSNGRYDTKIFWYLTDYQGNYNKNIQYRARVWMNDLTNAAVGSSIISCSNESWLGDHQGHRLYDYTNTGYGKVQATAKVRYWNKRIVDEVGDTRPGREYCNITRGKQVVYRLRFANDRKKDFTLTGADFYDVLPRATGFSWEKGVNVSLDYVNFDVTGADEWKIEKYSGNNWSDEYRIKWDDSRFSMTCTDQKNGVGYVYVTVTFPEGTAWDTYVRTMMNTNLTNTLYVRNTSGTFSRQSVNHDLADKAVVRLQKGVYATGLKYENDTVSRYKTTDDSRLKYENSSVATAKVYYYITLHNGGYTNLYLSPLQDVLPRGFRVLSVTQAYYNYSDGTRQATVAKGEDGPRVSYPDSLGVSYTTRDVADRQRVTITLQPAGQYNDHTGSRQYYLSPGQAAVLMLECTTDANPENTDDAATNIVAMPFNDYFGTGLELSDSTSAPAKVNGAEPERNDGGCDIIDNVAAQSLGCSAANTDNTTQWLASDVTLSRGGIKPGINKYLVKSIKESNGKVQEISRPICANPQDKLIWSVTGMNDGENALVDYAITDVLPDPYNFVGEICYRQNTNLYGQTAPALETLFTIERGKVDANGQAVADDDPSAVGASSSMTLVSAGGDRVPLTLNGGQAELNYKGSRIFVRIDVDDQQREVLSIRFPDRAMCIPSGGEVELTYTTKYIMGVLFNAVKVNYAYLTPLSQTWEGGAQHGNRVDFPSPYSDGDHSQSVTSNDQIIASYGGSTTSIKAIREKENAANAARSTDNPNYITVQDASRVVTYTLSVKNTNLEAMKRMVLIDNLPEPGDHTVFNVMDMRESAFRVRLDKDTEFRLWIIKANGDRVELEEGPDKDYEIQYSDKTTFETSDWGANDAAGWTKWTGPVASTEDIHSIRLVFHDPDPNCVKYPAYGELFMEFDARIDANARPGAIAYNSFGYNFTLKSGKRAEASPRLVGVRVPDLPHIKKRLVNGRDGDYAADEAVSFEYVLYRGEALTIDAGANAIEKLREAQRDYAIVSVTVPQGQSASQADVSFNDPEQVQLYRDGAYATGPWVMEDGRKYTLLELPTAHYGAVSTGGSPGGSFTFTYDMEEVRTLQSVNRHDDWSFRMQKHDQFQQPIGGVVFAVYSNVEREAMAQADYAALEGDKPGYELAGAYAGYKLMAVRTTDGAGSFQLDTLSGETYVCVEQSVPSAIYTFDPTPIEVTRENGERLKLVPVVNQYSSSGEASFTLQKHLQGRPLKAREFQFKIEPYDPIARAVITDEDKLPPMPAVTEGIANDADGALTFGPFTFKTEDIGREYCYRVTEMIPAEEDREQNIIYDDTQGIVRARVTDNGDGTLSARWTFTKIDAQDEEAEWDGVFRNACASQTSISIPAKKTLTGKSWEDERFTFHLVDVTDAGSPADEAVTVANGDAIAFTRTYTHEDDGRTFEYDLYEEIPDNAVGYRPNGERMKIVINDQRVLVHYGEYRGWTQSEREARLDGVALSWKAAGIFYDDRVHHVTVQVNYDEDAKGVKADVTLDGQPVDAAAIEAVEFANRFMPENIRARIKASKKVWWPEKSKYRLLGTGESFTFRLIPDTATQPMPDPDTVTITRGPEDEVYNSFTIPLSWEALTALNQVDAVTGEYTGEFLYTIIELKPDGTPAAEEDGYIDQIRYDATSRRVKIVMTGDPDDYSMTARVLYYDDESGEWGEKKQKYFQNEYRTEPIGFPVTIEKKLNGKGAYQGSYSFTLYDAEDDSPVKTLQMNDPDGKPLTENITVADLGEKGGLNDREARSFYLLEDIPEEAVACDRDGKPIEPAQTYGDGAHRDEYTWKLNGCTYDTGRINIRVTARLDEAMTYRLIPTVTYGTNNTKASFNNAYAAEGAAQIEVLKTLTGREFKDGEAFTFELTPVEGAPMVVGKARQTRLTASTAADGTDRHKGRAVFAPLEYTIADITNARGEIEARTFKYKLHEQIPEGATETSGEDGEKLYTFEGVTYAPDQTIEVVVSDNGAGALNVVVNGGAAIGAENVYRPIPTRLSFKARKEILDKSDNKLDEWKVPGDAELDWSDKTFTFTLEPFTYADHASPRPTAEGGDTVTVDFADQEKAFGEIEFTHAGTYEYYITEALPEGLDNPYSTGESLLYDDTRHVVRVVVQDAGDGSELTATVTYDGKAVDPEGASLAIQNRVLSEYSTITFNKRWFLDDIEQTGNEAQGLPDEIALHLRRVGTDGTIAEIDFTDEAAPVPVENGAEAQPLTLKKAENWTRTLDNLLNYEVTKDGVFIAYSYYVIEEPLGIWQAEYTDGKLPWAQASEIRVGDGGAITVKNAMYTVSLPNTGGPGTSLFTASGIAFIALALAMLLRRRKT